MNTCVICADEFQPKTWNQVACRKCAPAYKRSQNQKRLKAFRLRQGSIPLGTVLQCSACGEDFIYRAGPQRRCESCQQKQERCKADAWIAANKLKVSRYRKVAKENYEFSGNRKRSLDRDKHRCRKCGATGDLHTHHIDGKGKGVPKPQRNDSVENLITLCKTCHRRLHVLTEKMLYDKHRDTVMASFMRFIQPAPPTPK